MTSSTGAEQGLLEPPHLVALPQDSAAIVQNMLGVHDIPDKQLGYRFVKRVFDIVFSGLVIVVGFIPGVILSFAIAKDTGGSPMYTQYRYGKRGRKFKIYKFRTMVVDSDNVEKYFTPEQLHEWHTERKVTDDPRITKLGRVLREYSIDEFANFLNVFKGDMSVIGPRAMVHDELAWFGNNLDKILSVPCGITGWWQVSSRNKVTFESGKRQELELEYVDKANIGFDFKIFLKTFKAIFGGTGQ